jgi:hypothetical protein
MPLDEGEPVSRLPWEDVMTPWRADLHRRMSRGRPWWHVVGTTKG